MYYRVRSVGNVNGLVWALVDFWLDQAHQQAGEVPARTEDFLMQLSATSRTMSNGTPVVTPTDINAEIKRRIAWFVGTAGPSFQRGSGQDTSGAHKATVDQKDPAGVLALVDLTTLNSVTATVGVSG